MGIERRLSIGVERRSPVLRSQRPYVTNDHLRIHGYRSWLRARLPGSATERGDHSAGHQGLRRRPDKGEAYGGESLGGGGQQLGRVGKMGFPRVPESAVARQGDGIFGRSE